MIGIASAKPQFGPEPYFDETNPGYDNPQQSSKEENFSDPKIVNQWDLLDEPALGPR